MKLKVNRLKVAQISRDQLLPQIRYYCLENPAFVDTDSDLNDIICYSSVFNDQLSELKEESLHYPVEGGLKEYKALLTVMHELEDLIKQFCSYDYIMLINVICTNTDLELTNSINKK